MRNLFLTTLIFTIVWMASVAFVIAEPANGRDHLQKNPANALRRIELSNEQTETIMKLRQNHEKAIAPLRIKEHQLNSELEILWLQITPDIEKIRSVQKEMHAVKFQILEKETQFRIAMREVMTEEQLYRFLALGGDRCHDPDKRDHRPH